METIQTMELYTVVIWENGKMVDIAGTFDNFDAAFEAAVDDAREFMSDYSFEDNRLMIYSANNYEESSIDTAPTIVIKYEDQEKCSDVWYYDIVKHFLNLHEWLNIDNTHE